jgi:hypothetical protein
MSPWTNLHAFGGWKLMQRSQRWGRVLIIGDRLADLYLRHGLRRSCDCRRAERKRRAGEQHAA